MTLDEARRLLATQADFGGFHDRNAAGPILAEVSRACGRTAVGRDLREPDLERTFGFEFRGGLAMKDTFGK